MKTKTVIILFLILIYGVIAFQIWRPIHDNKKHLIDKKLDEFGGVLVDSNAMPKTLTLDEADQLAAEPNPLAHISTVATNANGTPYGAWAATLVPDKIDGNLYRDPATGNLYCLQDGAIVKNTNPYAGLTLEQMKLLASLQSEQQRPLPTPVFINYSLPPIMAQPVTLPDPMTSYYQNRILDQNQQALETLQQIQRDNEQAQQQQALRDIMNRKP